MICAPRGAISKNELGDRFDAARIDAFLQTGPAMVDFFERETAVRFVPGLLTPDFHPQSEGAGIGRSLCASPFDASELGDLLSKLRPPLDEITYSAWESPPAPI